MHTIKAEFFAFVQSVDIISIDSTNKPNQITIKSAPLQMRERYRACHVYHFLIQHSSTLSQHQDHAAIRDPKSLEAVGRMLFLVDMPSKAAKLTNAKLVNHCAPAPPRYHNVSTP